MTSLDTMVAALRADGYKVALIPKNTLGTKEVVITIKGMELEKETSVSYFITYSFLITFVSNDVSVILSETLNIINKVEKATYTTVRNVLFESPEVNMTEGELYIISIPFTYKEVINIS